MNAGRVPTSGIMFSRELSWLAFSRRVLALATQDDLPLLERVRFLGITGMLHDEFFVKRMSGLRRKRRKLDAAKESDGKMHPRDELKACRTEIESQRRELQRLLAEVLRPALTAAGAPVRSFSDLSMEERTALRTYFQSSVLPILTPLAVDAEHPFPFISSLGLNLAVLLRRTQESGERFVRLKIPGNRPRWVPVPGGAGFTPIEEVVGANLDLLFPAVDSIEAYLFRVTRGIEGNAEAASEANEDIPTGPGSIVWQVTNELKARKFAGVSRMEVDARTPKPLIRWLAEQVGVEKDDIFKIDGLFAPADLSRLDPPGHAALRFPSHQPARPPRLAHIESPDDFFAEIRREDILLHHPYESFDAGVLEFLEAAARDPQVLAIKLTIYRTSADSPIIKALAHAARMGKQVAVLVEITARLDEAPNIAWGRFLEKEGVHVAYGVARLKTHVKLALVVREEGDQLRRYVHVGTGNYHTGTARVYEDVGLLSAEPKLADEITAMFNALTGVTPHPHYERMLVAPINMRQRFIDLIRREVTHARAGRKARIRAKMNQLQDADIIRELYAASQAGVQIWLLVRGLCCLRPRVPGLSDNIEVVSIVGRFLEHSRIYEFWNDGDAEIFMGSADWMKRNLSRRVESIVGITSESARARLMHILDVYQKDRGSAWFCDMHGQYVRRPEDGDDTLRAQDEFLREARAQRPEESADIKAS